MVLDEWAPFGDPSVLYCNSRERLLCYRLFLLTIATLYICVGYYFIILLAVGGVAVGEVAVGGEP